MLCCVCMCARESEKCAHGRGEQQDEVYNSRSAAAAVPRDAWCVAHFWSLARKSNDDGSMIRLIFRICVHSIRKGRPHYAICTTSQAQIAGLAK